MLMSMLSIAANLLLAAAPSATALVPENCEFGEVYAFNKVECQFTLSNTGDKPIHVSGIVPNRPGDVSEQKELVIAPRSHAYLKVQLNTDNTVGNANHAFRFRSDEAGAEYRVNAHGFVMSALDQFQPEIDLGVADAGAEQQGEHKIELSSHDSPDFGIAKILDTPSWLDASIGSDGHSVEVKLRRDANWGAYAGFVKLALRGVEQKQAAVAVKVDVHGDVTPAFNPLNLGLLRVGDKNQFRIPLKSRGERAFEVGKVELVNLKGDAKATPCVPAAAGCRWLELTISDQQTMGLLKGDVVVSFAHEQRKLDIAVKGFLAEKDFVTKKVDQETLNAEAKGPGSSVLPRAALPSDLNKAIQNAVKEGDESAPPGNGPLLKWRIANGRTIHGFQIFRANAAEGPFVLLNKPAMPSTAEDDDSVGYQYRDTSAEAGKTYWYYIGLVYSDGHKQQLTSPQKVVAK